MCAQPYTLTPQDSGATYDTFKNQELLVILCAARMLVHACKHVLAQLHDIYITALDIAKCRFIQLKLKEYPTLFKTADQLSNKMSL